MPSLDWVDPEELPFSRAELYSAAVTFLPEAHARAVADTLADLGPTIIAARAERRAIWRAGGIANADGMLLGAWEYPAELLPALASLSSELAHRVHLLRERLKAG